MDNFDESKITPLGELDDDMLDGVSGGAIGAGTVVYITYCVPRYCPTCGRLLQNAPATIRGVRGILDGKTIYWCKYNCCGHKTSVSETAIVG